MIETDKNELNTINIFDEFDVDDVTKNEINELEKPINKDFYYYISKVSSFLKVINYLIFILFTSSFIYVFIQNSDSDLFDNKEYLNPFCGILIGPDTLSCSSIKISSRNMENKIKELEKSYIQDVVTILNNKYEIDNIKNSKAFIFIIDKNKYKNDPYNILNEFDKIKNEFTSIDKKKIQCSKVSITGNIFKAYCSAFSTLWYNNIPGSQGDKLNTIEGTSISLASSFINYLSKKPKINILNKQKTFESNTYFGEGNYTYNTNFKIEFEYSNNDLSL